jgi:subtilisin-like proprotein convertase family protein/type II secretory pathway pseudopilin PulG
MTFHHHSRRGLSAIFFLLIVSFIFIPIASQAAPDQSPQGQVQRAWALAAEAGQYHFSSRVIQKTALAPSIANAGRSSRVETLYLDGETDLASEALTMRLWQNGGNVNNPTDAAEIRVAGADAYGRVSGGAWQPIDNFTGGLAPGSDFTSFLVAAQNVEQIIASEEANHTQYVSQYAFELNGVILAAHIRAQLEDHLRQNGSLPAGLRISAPEQYRNAVGSGEVWLDRTGLPLRLAIDIQYPQQKNGERVSAQIYTDFSNFNREAIANNQSAVNRIQASVSKNITKFQQPENLLSIAFLGLIGLGILNSKSKHIYVAVVIAVILSMVVTPLIQGYQVYAFFQEQAEQQDQYDAAAAERQAQFAAQDKIQSSSWDPHNNQLSAVSGQPSEMNSRSTTRNAQTSAANTEGDDSADDDGDGLVNADDPCDDTDDCDGDGLTDLQESRLGTDIEDKDTDGDQITDNAEIKGFWYANQWWYTNPLNLDTNGDGTPDNIECEARAVDVEAGEVSPDGKTVVCQDTDEDNIPDPFDRDDDGDLVPDLVDLSPFKFEDNAGNLFDEDNPLLLQVDGLEADQPAFVDFQLRPQTEEHLWYALNVLDWPSNDQRGQIQRKKGNNSTFEDVAEDGQAVAENAGNGDMRLVPMLEIIMPGDSIPLKLANPEIDVVFSGDLDVTLHFEQNGANIDMTFDADDTYDVEINRKSCNDLASAIYAWDDLADGSARTISENNLTGLANGKHGIKLTKGSDEYCLDLGNVVNGPYTDKIIDRAPLDPYSISIREKDESGTLLAYLPLNIVADETEADRVAFTGRMHYWPSTADWGDTQKVNVVWVVQMLVDHQCSEAEDFAGACTEDEWILDATQIVRAYPETWYLSGLTVNEDHGVDVGIIIEDPSQESEADRQYDESLWNLAWGLDKSFLVGRDQDDDNNRDITISEIVNRWDYPTNDANYADGDDELWGVPITSTKVLTYAYDISDQMIQIAMTETEKILDDYFKDYVSAGGDAPTLLFTQEAHYRSAALNSDATTTETVSDTVMITVQIDSDKSQEETRVSLNWASYRYNDTDDAWESYPLDEYWDKIEVRYEELFDEYQDDPDYEDIRRGQVFIAQSFYLAMYRGNSALVQVGDELIGAYHDMAYTDIDLEDQIDNVMEDAGIIVRVTKLMTELYADLITKGMNQKTLLKNVKGLEDVFSDEIQETKKSTRKAGLMVAAAWATMALYVVAEHYGLDPLVHTLNAGIALKAMFELYQAITDYRLLGSMTGRFGNTLGVTIVGLILTELASWGIFMYQIFSAGLKAFSMAANYAFATQVAATIAGIILLLIAAIPVVGQIIAAVIGLIDSTVMLICAAVKSKHGVCRGITGWLAFGIRWLIYSGNVMIDLSDDKRLSISDVTQDFLEVTEGMAVGNSLIWEATFANTIKHIDWTDTQGSFLAGLYWWQYSDDNLRSSNFHYHLHEGPEDEHQSIARNIIRNYQWDPDKDGEDAYTYSDDDSTEIPLTQAGINQPLDFYLNEGYAVPAQECWLMPNPLVLFTGVPVIPVCYVRTEKGTNNINLGEKMRVDIFPATLNEFYSLTTKNMGQSLAWSQGSSPGFPRLKDADGDGLRNKADGGADPDDTTWDSDGDRLSDYFEIEIGSNPQDWDTDNDQLGDYDEVINKTDINRADSDYDGLTDKEELDGWEFVYDFAADGSQISTWVTSNPLAIDSDDDSFSDFQEKTYGFHPRVKSDPSILTLESDVFEEQAPHLLLRLDETENATAFRDISGYDHNGNCENEFCPTAGHAGKYNNAPYFDGSQYIVADSAVQTLNGAAISFGGWAKPQAGMSENGIILSFHTAEYSNRLMVSFNPTSRQFIYYAGTNHASASTFALDDWHHVMVVIDENDNGVLYVNGNSEATFTSTARPATDGRCSIGQEWDSDTASNFFKGFLDEIVIIPAAISNDGVLAIQAGRHNPEDLTVKPNDNLYYEAAVKNELFNRYAEGLLSTDFPTAFSELPPQDFVLNPQESAILSGTVEVGTAASRVYTLTQEADALITDWRAESNYAEALYHFSDSGTFLEDHSGSQPPRDAECDGHCPTLTDGRYGNGAAFNGSSQFFGADKVSEVLADAASFSYGGWVFPDSSHSGRGTIVAFESDTGGDYNMVKYNYDTRKFYYFDHQNEKFSTSTFDPDQWYHVMVVIEEGSSDNGILYVNGIEERRFTPRYSPESDGKFSIGHDWDGYLQGSHDLFAGSLDEIVVYPKALDYQEIQDLYNNPIFHLPLDENQGATEFEDDSGFNNNAVCSGAACPTAGEEGLALDALDFDGEEYVSVSGSETLKLSAGDFTISTWVYPERDSYEPSTCGFIYEYFSNQSLYGEPSITRCEDYSLDTARSSSSLNSARWVGKFYFPEGTHDFSTRVSDGYRVYVDGTKIFGNDWAGSMSSNYDNFSHYFTEGYHTIKVESRNNHRVSGNNLDVKVDISPGPYYHPQGIFGGTDYPSIHRLGRRLKLVFNDGTEFFTGNVLSNNNWNHVTLTFADATKTLTVYVDGSDVGQFAVAGQVPAAGQNFDIGRVPVPATLTINRLTMENIGDDDDGIYCNADWNDEIYIQAQIDGTWENLWYDDSVTKDEDFSLNIGRTFTNDVVIRLLESDAGEYNHSSCNDDPADDPLSDEIFSTFEISPYNTLQRFENSRNDVADLFYTIDNSSRAFEGKIDEVSIYKTAFDSGEVLNLYESGTLVLHLPLDDPPGASDFIDAVGQHNGACDGANCPIAGVQGRAEMALRFDGTDDVVTVNDAGTADIQNISIAAWVRVSALGGIMNLVSVGNDKAAIFTDQNDLRFVIGDHQTYHYVRPNITLSENTWFHIAGTYDGNTMRLYLDGTEIGTEAIATTLKGGDQVWLSDPGQPLDGYLDDVRVYRRVLTASQIENIYTAAPEMLLTLDETIGATTFTDLTDNGHDAVCSGNNCPETGANGQIGLAAIFDGENYYLEIPNNQSPSPGDEMTLAIWVKLTDAEPNQKLIGKTNNTPNRGFVLGVEDGQLYPEIWNTDGTRYAGQWGQINPDYWTHLAITFKKNGDLVGYINGNEAGRIDAGSKALGASSNPLRIGAAPWNTSRNEANGHLDHITLYNQALSASEIKAMFRLQAKWVEERYHTPIKLDNEAPTSTLLTTEKYRPNRDVMLTVEAQDASTQVLLVEMGVSANGGAYTWKAAPPCQNSTTTWCPTFEPTLGEDQYTLQFRATDEVGNRESGSQLYAIIVDDTPPGVDDNFTENQILDPVLQPDNSWLVNLSGTVSDPAINSDPGSGVYSVDVKLTDQDTVTDTLYYQAATLGSGTWETQYPLHAADPTGTYTLSAIATDNVSNSVTIETLVHISLDGSPPVASLNDITEQLGISGTITTTLQIGGQITETGDIQIGIRNLEIGFTPAAMASYSNTLAIFHFNEVAGATEFENVAGQGNAICSGSTCPTAAQPGIWGTSLLINANSSSSENYLTADAVSTAYTDSLGLSFGAWVYPNYNSQNSRILAFDTANGADRNQIIHNEYWLKYGDGSQTIIIAHTSEKWIFVMVTIDTTGNGTIYLNGAPIDNFTTTVRPDPDGFFTIGAQKNTDGDYDDFFRGNIDEAMVYNRVLAPSEVMGLYAEAELSAAGQGVLTADWTHTVSDTFDGLYQIDIFPGDIYSNTAPRSEWWAWTGEIDTRGPRVDLQIEEKSEQIGSAGNAKTYNVTTDYTCWAQDFNLVLYSEQDPSLNFDCPCVTVAPLSTVITNTFYHEVSPWYADVFTDTTRLYETLHTCTVLGPQTAANYIEACDRHGRCTTGQDNEPVQLASQIPALYTNILTPTHNTIITSTAQILIEGKTYSRDPLDTVEVWKSDSLTAIGTPVDYTCAPTNPTTMTEWTSPWTPSEGVHQLYTRSNPCVGSPYRESGRTLYVDTIPPGVSLSRTELNRSQRISYGRVNLKGSASDATSGLDTVQVSVDGSDWAPASIQGNNWKWEWNLGEEPDNAQFLVSVLATDRAGWTQRITQTVTVDLDAPNPITMTVSSGGAPLSQGEIITATPATIDLSWEASEPAEKLSHYEVQWTIHTTDTTKINTVVLPNQTLSSSYAAADGQRIAVQVTSVFTDGNDQVDSWGPVYVDSPLTADYVQIQASLLPYHSWMDSGCSNMGIDRRVKENAGDGVALDDPQNFYVSWDSGGLRLAWLGANWDYNGDLFIYMDDLTDPSTPLLAFNPFTKTQDTQVIIPGARAFIWVQDSRWAELHFWNGETWEYQNLDETQYRFDPGLNGGHTDLYIPFESIGITQTAITPLVLYAFATDEGEMRLWSTMPPQNPVNADRVVETGVYAGAQQALQWSQTYAWANLGAGVCPNNSNSPNPQFPDSDLRFGLSAAPDGTTYGLVSNELFWMAKDLTNSERDADISQSFTFMDVEHRPVGDGDTIEYTIAYENRGTYTASNVIVEANSLYALKFSGASTRTITATIGNIAPGTSGSITFAATVDGTGPHNQCMSDGGTEDSCAVYLDWAVLNALIFDDAHGPGGNPLEWLWADHEVDSEPPEFFGILSPDYFIGAEAALFKGYAFDISGVPTLTLETDPPSGNKHQTECQDETPYNGAWLCEWNATTANGGSAPSDGDIYQIRLKATDGVGLSSSWSEWHQFMVDTVVPTITVSTETTETYSGTVTDVTAATFYGSAGDNHGLGGVEICVDGDCSDANLQLTGTRTYQYNDETGTAISIGVCGGSEIARTFTVTDSFSLGGVRLGFNADHAKRDELRVSLSSPDGTAVTIITPPEGSYSAFENFDLLLNDAATNGLHDFKANDNPAEPYYERLSRPENPLDAFYGENSNGTWTLTICDTDDNSDSGSYNRARLILEKRNAAVTHADWFYTLTDLEDQDYVSHTLTAHALDLANNRSTDGATLTFRVDNVNPTITVTDTVELAEVTTSVRVLAGTTNDGGEVETLYANVHTPSGNRISMQIGRNGASWWLEFTPEEIGEYTIWINAEDLGENITTAGSFNLTVMGLDF